MKLVNASTGWHFEDLNLVLSYVLYRTRQELNLGLNDNIFFLIVFSTNKFKYTDSLEYLGRY